METDGEWSVIATVQLVSNYSQTSLKAGSLTFFPLHINVLSFSEEIRRVQIVKGRTILACLPDMLSPIEETLKTGHLYQGRFTWTDTLQTFYGCIKYVPKNLSKSSIEDFS